MPLLSRIGAAQYNQQGWTLKYMRCLSVVIHFQVVDIASLSFHKQLHRWRLNTPPCYKRSFLNLKILEF